MVERREALLILLNEVSTKYADFFNRAIHKLDKLLHMPLRWHRELAHSVLRRMENSRATRGRENGITIILLEAQSLLIVLVP